MNEARPAARDESARDEGERPREYAAPRPHLSYGDTRRLGPSLFSSLTSERVSGVTQTTSPE